MAFLSGNTATHENRRFGYGQTSIESSARFINRKDMAEKNLFRAENRQRQNTHFQDIIMSYETCSACSKSGETDNDDGGLFIRRYRARGVRIEYVCSNCVDAESTSIPYGDEYEERKIREREK
jgi:DNA-directed RNA polymerase subunit RPC12/RpoP